MSEDKEAQNKQLYFPKTPDYRTQDVVFQSNYITLAKYDYDLTEKRLFYMLIDRVRKVYIEKTAVENTDVDLFGNMMIRIYSSELQQHMNITRLYSRLHTFKNKSFEIINEEGDWLAISLVNFIEHKKGKNYIEMEVSRKLMPHLVQLSHKFTAYSLTVALSFKSTYTTRFYELCQMWRSKGYFFYSLEELREKFGLENNYKKFNDFKTNVLDKAKDELYQSFISDESLKSEVYFDWSIKTKGGKKGNRVDEIEFYIYDSLQSNLLGNWGLVDFHYNIRQLLAKYIKSDPTYITRINENIKNVTVANLVFEKLQDKIYYYKEQQKTDNEMARLIRSILKEDFNLS